MEKFIRLKKMEKYLPSNKLIKINLFINAKLNMHWQS
jgi:hypothetical protein